MIFTRLHRFFVAVLLLSLSAAGAASAQPAAPAARKAAVPEAPEAIDAWGVRQACRTLQTRPAGDGRLEARARSAAIIPALAAPVVERG